MSRQTKTEMFRWGAIAHPGMKSWADIYYGRLVAAVVDPDLTSEERAELEKPLKALHPAYASLSSPVTAACAAFLLAILAVAAIGPVFPGDWRVYFAGVIVAPVLAWHVDRWRLRRAATIPEKFHGRVLTGAAKRVDDAVRMDVLRAAGSLSTLEHTPGTRDSDVDAEWRALWEELTRVEGGA